MPGQNGVGSRAGKKRKLQNTPVNGRLGKLSRRQGLHVCKYCDRDISQAVRIRCASCSGFQLCLYCFAMGVELRQHKKDHAYQVHGDLSFPLYDLQWGADEEMLLLEGIDSFGLGNWSAVSKNVGSKTAAECRDHYFEIFVRSSEFPLPKANSHMAGRDPLQVAREQQTELDGAAGSDAVVSTDLQEAEVAPAQARSSDAGNVGALRPTGLDDTAKVDQGSEAQGALDNVPSMQPAENASGSKGIDLAAPPPKKVRPGKVDLSAPNGPKMDAVDQQQLSTRGLPSRPLAALQASGLGVTIGKQPSELQKVEGYQPEISGFHAKRFEFDHEYDNDAELLISEIEFLPTDTPEEHNEKLQLVEIYNQRLTEREHRRSKVISRGLMDVRRAQAHERRQTPAERELHSQMRVFARYQSPAEHEELLDGLLLEQRIRTRLEELKEMREAGVRTFEDAEEYEAEKRKHNADSGRTGDWPHRQSFQMEDSSLASQGMLTPLSGTETSSRGRELSRLRASSGAASPAPAWLGRDGSNAAAHLAAWRSRRGFALDITAFDGADILSSKERHLCATERLLPHQYLAYKASLLREAEREGPAFTRNHAKYMFRLRSPLAVKIYDFMITCGWLMASQSAQPGEAPGDAAYFSDNAGAASPAHSNSK